VRRLALSVVVVVLVAGCGATNGDPLPSWNPGPTREAILDFVARVTDPASPDFVPEPERIAVFDNDGTLWSEKPYYVQLAFALDRVARLAPEHPEWSEDPVLAAAAAGDLAAVAAAGEAGLMKVIMATHAGLTAGEFTAVVEQWLATARHPQLDRPYTELVYQPMLELLAYLRDHGFRTWIVSGGGIEFMRPWTEAVYGIPPEQVVGSSIETVFEMRADGPVLVRQAAIDFIDDKAGKPVGIHRFIGRRPIAAFGNSDGDLQMLQWTTAGAGARLGVLIRHTDAEREFAYDRESHVGRLDAALDEAAQRGWTVVDMKNDWTRIYP